MNPEKQVSPKVTLAVLAGAVTTLLAWVLSEAARIDLPPEVAAAVTTIIIGAAAYLKRDPKRVDTPDPNRRA